MSEEYAREWTAIRRDEPAIQVACDVCLGNGRAMCEGELQTCYKCDGRGALVVSALEAEDHQIRVATRILEATGCRCVDGHIGREIK